MSKKINMVSLALAIFFLFPRVLFADLILLKSGGVMQGEILSEEESVVKLKDELGTIEKVKRNLIASIVKQKEELALTSEELYAQKIKAISSGDAKAHYELGLFCVRNGLFDYAVKEFNKAKEIDPKYEKLSAKEIEYMDSVKKRAQEIAEAANKLKESALSIGQITDEFQKGGLPAPFGSKDVYSIVSVINSLDREETRQEYAVRYLKLGDDYAGRAKTAEADPYTYDIYSAAGFCYEIAYRSSKDPQTSSLAQKKNVDIQNSLEKIKIKLAIIPYSPLERDAIILFIRGLQDTAQRSSYYSRYYKIGGEFKVKVIRYGISAGEDNRKNLEVALYCYEIAKSANNKDILSNSIIEARIKECEEALKNMKSSPEK